MDDMMVRLLNVSVSGLQYVGMIQQNSVYMPRLEHLTCYLPGNLALGVAYGAVTGPKAEHYMSLAQNLTYSCWQMYDRMPIGAHPPHACRCWKRCDRWCRLDSAKLDVHALTLCLGIDPMHSLPLC